MTATEFLIQILIEKGSDGRFHVSSPHLAGLHLAGRDWTAIRADLEPIVKDLLFHNLDVVADQIRWIPSLDEALRPMTQPAFSESHPGKANFLVITARAA